MIFMGMFMLFVLPLFLVVSARMAFADNRGGGAKFVGVILYLFALLSILGSVLVLVELLTT